ncbi:MAG: acylphosphatase [Candidatus Peribacteraceae bacterium]|nr:acylphosphatase [Candidatus Peribacteraceae bacterium]MDD5742710.1 acylphosphatase [Candidatus Peribacteraceae bacterium]
MPARHILIDGYVQGVNFRHEAKAKADALKLTGWVRNNDDGSLEMHIEGRADALQQFEQWCQRGPQPARVEAMKVKDDIEDYGKGFVVQM